MLPLSWKRHQAFDARQQLRRTRCHVVAINVFIVLLVLPFLAVQFFVFVIFFVPTVILFLLVQVGIEVGFAFWQSRQTSLLTAMEAVVALASKLTRGT